MLWFILYLLHHMTEIFLKKNAKNFFETFEDTTDCTKWQNSVSSRLIIPSVLGLKYHLEQKQSKFDNVQVF